MTDIRSERRSIIDREEWGSETSIRKELEMLVLTRRKDESIVIGENTEVSIVDICCKKVRLGITAPKSVPVLSPLIIDAAKYIIAD